MEPAVQHHREVYPRVCGGTIQYQINGRLGAGLSPRVRGNREKKMDNDRRRGSIPACAGEPLFLPA